MKQYILLLVLMVMGAGMTVHAEDVNPVKVGNVISGHIIEKGTEASLGSVVILGGLTFVNFPLCIHLC